VPVRATEIRRNHLHAWAHHDRLPIDDQMVRRISAAPGDFGRLPAGHSRGSAPECTTVDLRHLRRRLIGRVRRSLITRMCGRPHFGISAVENEHDSD